MKKIGGLKAVVLLAAIFAVVSFGRVEASAATEYKQVTVPNGGTQKAGNYYFTYDYEQKTVSMSTEENGEYQATPLSYSFFSNGEQCYYMDENFVIYSYVFATGENTKLKTIPKDGDAYYTISTVYKNYIYVNKESFDQWKLWTYAYNIKTGKYKKIATNCSVSDRSGSYVVGCNEHRSDVSPYKITLYKIKSDGSFKKVKVITKHGRGECFEGGKLYYTTYKTKYIASLKYTTADMKQTTLYRARVNGSGAKKIATFKAKKQYGEVLAYNITAKNCYVYKDGTTYLYTYSTKKYKKIS